MKTAAIAIAASSLLMGAEAGSLFRRHAHKNLHKRSYEIAAPEPETCKVVYYTTWVDYNPPKPTYETTEYVKSTVTVVPTPYTTLPPTYTCPVPTPDVTTYPTPGTYTHEAKTITLTQTETVCGATTAVLTPGCNTYGYQTTVIDKATTVTCPLATITTSGSTVYTTLTNTVFECPTPGTYTYGGYTSTVTDTVTVTYPIPSTYTPGTYTAPLKTVTVTEKDYVYTCPYGAYVPPPPPPTTTPAPAKPVEKPVEYPTETYVAPPPATTKKTTPKPSVPAGPIDYNNIGKGKQWCITYTQYNNDKSCKGRAAIFEDIRVIKEKGFRSIRVYAPDCDALDHITDACDKYGLKIVMGIFIRKSGYSYDVDDVYKQVSTLIAWKRWDICELVVVGNESVWGGVISSSDLVGLISNVKTQFKGAGYPGKITTSEVVSSLEANPGLCSVIDVVAVNIQPYFNGGYAADAGKFLKSQLAQAKAVCGIEAFCLEAGWPSGGEPINNAIAGPNEQYAAIKSIYDVDDGHISYFSMFDDEWKDPNLNGGVENHFGCAKLFPFTGY